MHEADSKDIEEIKISLTSWQNNLNKSEDRILDLEDMVAESGKIRKDLQQTIMMQAKLIQYQKEYTNRNNMRLIGINEKEGINKNDIKSKRAEVTPENFSNMSKQSAIH